MRYPIAEGPLMPVMILSKEYEFSAAHALPMVPMTHKCHNLHGHNWQVRVCVSGVVCSDGFVCDYGDIDNYVKPLVSKLDHQNLNDILPNPTSENICIYFWEQLAKMPGLYEISISENARTLCTYRGEK